MEKRAYEKGFRNLEDYVYTELDHFIEIAGVNIDTRDKTVYYLAFLSEDYTPAPDHPEYQIADKFMYMFNTYSEEHPGELPGEDYKICVDIYDRQGGFWTGVAKITNYVYEEEGFDEIGEPLEIMPRLCAVNFFVPVEYGKFLCKDDIIYLDVWRQVGMEVGISVDHLRELLGQFENLRYVRIVSPDPEGEVWTMLDTYYPDLIRL